MKKTLLLTLALGLASAATLTAGTVEVFITGSTAFRANVYGACKNLFVTPTIYYANAANGGADSGFSSTTASWVMTGTPITALTNVYDPGHINALPSGTTLIIHGLFTGSIQGLATVEGKTNLTFAVASGTQNGLTSAYTTNSPTIGFSDAKSTSTPFAVTTGFNEESCAIQPFVWVASPAAFADGVQNVSWEQAQYGIQTGRIPLASWTGKTNDLNTYVYVAQRTLDSGTRRVETAMANFTFNDTVGSYIWDANTKTNWYAAPAAITQGLTGGNNVSVVGAAGLNNANLAWGPGYVAGGDLRGAVIDGSANNLSIGLLSVSDAKSAKGDGVISSNANWGLVCSFNGYWPTTSGAGIHANTVTNNFSPVTSGFFPAWAEEVFIYSTAQNTISDSKITDSQLGTGATPGTFLGVFNGQNAASPIVGSLDNEIYVSAQSVAGTTAGTYPNTAIRLSDMKTKRDAVGGGMHY
ncbi:MAG TPA: hypothetical protein VK815_16340 [Candidatus Acidoferrales bacterium]|nr:hypothetical protein [Candidatus Acidoferrales bacterium]